MTADSWGYLRAGSWEIRWAECWAAWWVLNWADKKVWQKVDCSVDERVCH
jgi:hypothetical protein